jgi:hypothetical protein
VGAALQRPGRRCRRPRHRGPRTSNGNRSRPQCVRWVAPEPCREGAMATSHVRAPLGRAGALLGAIAVLVTGCAAAGGGPQAGQTGAAQAAPRSSGHTAAHRAAVTTRPGGVRHGSESRTAWNRPLPQCAYSAGRPVVAGPRSPVAEPRCPCCLWCDCAWSCCGCSPGWWSARPYPARQFCPCWEWPPIWGGSPISSTSGPAGRAHVCPTWRQSLGPSACQGRCGFLPGTLPGSMTAGAR